MPREVGQTRAQGLDMFIFYFFFFFSELDGLGWIQGFDWWVDRVMSFCCNSKIWMGHCRIDSSQTTAMNLNKCCIV